MTSESAPPSGGMGGHDAPPDSLPFGPIPRPHSPRSIWRRIAVLVGVVGVVAVSGGVGMRVYVDRAKTMEARLSLRKIANLSRAHHAEHGAFCASASRAVPESMPSAGKYTPRPNEWQADAAENAGFACLGFEGPFVQYFQYTYVATPTGFTATARGHVHEDGHETFLEASGTVDADGTIRLRKP